ncbi:uncharacterized protein LOC142625277 [Castanea sativa]|uniref:uncharacterized protein LOC142625277 n=1 Tax=Castanea sativa TaxID=21020 RepID=UPI003F650A4E
MWRLRRLFIRSWRGSRMSCISSGRARCRVTRQEGTKYHRDKGHTIEQCKEFVVAPEGGVTGQVSKARRDTLPSPLGVIKVIHVASIGTSVSRRKGVLSVVSIKNAECGAWPEKKLKLARGPIDFRDEDLEGTTQPHDDALIVTAKINDFIVKRVLRKGVEVMYPDLFKGLGLKAKDLSKYDTSLVGFDGRIVILEGQISLLVNTEGKEVMVNFIVVGYFSPYTTILGRPWIHAMEVVPSTLHVKVKFHTDQRIAVVRGDQQVVR